MAFSLERSPEVQRMHAKRILHCCYKHLCKWQHRLISWMRHPVPNIPVNGITEAKLGQGILLAAEPAQQL